MRLAISWENLSPDCQRRNKRLKDELSGKAEKGAKYNNVKVQLDGMVFDSKKEAAKYGELVLLKRAGEVIDFKHHPKAFVLQHGYMCQQTKKWVKPITYTPDFWVLYADGSEVWIDTKGYRTEVYKIKIKLFREKYSDLIFEEC
ncbi:MAG: hypothetical protein H6Q72_4199 [Firmicutes bacterium]|nr:hypothetical protein [Bacillota bacterium]